MLGLPAVKVLVACVEAAAEAGTGAGAEAGTEAGAAAEAEAEAEAAIVVVLVETRSFEPVRAISAKEGAGSSSTVGLGEETAAAELPSFSSPFI